MRNITLILILAQAGLLGCNPSKTKMNADQPLAAVPITRNDPELTPDPSAGPLSTSGTLPSADATPVLDIPVAINGALLLCYSDPNYDGKTISTSVNCAVRKAPAFAKVDLGTSPSNHLWSFTPFANILIAPEELPSASAWQVSYTLTAVTAEVLAANLAKISFSLTAFGPGNQSAVLEAKANISSLEALEDAFIRPKSQSNYCLDLFRGVTTPDGDLLTNSCDANIATQIFNFTAAGNLRASNDVCIETGRPTSCANLAREAGWYYDGHNLQIRNTDVCLSFNGLLTRFETCSRTDPKQDWIVGKKVFGDALRP